jgi:tetratricopeptide (TPR) repeat protein
MAGASFEISDDELDRCCEAITAHPSRSAHAVLCRRLRRRHPGRVLVEFADRLKLRCFDRLLHDDLKRAKVVAAFLYQLGVAARRPQILGLGLLARGDAERQGGYPLRAMRRFARAKNVYRTAGDRVGWARACSGWLAAATHAGRCTADDIARMEAALQVFREAGQAYRLAMAQQNIGWAYQWLGQHQEAVSAFQLGLGSIYQEKTTSSSVLRGMLLMNMGNSQQWLGKLKDAIDLHCLAQQLFAQLDEHGLAAIEEMNISLAERLRWHLHSALRASQAATIGLRTANQSLALATAMIYQADALLSLNRVEEARLLSEEADDLFRSFEAPIDRAEALHTLARVQMRLGRPARAAEALAEGERLATQAGARSMAYVLTIERAALLLALERAEEASELALSLLRARTAQEATPHRAMALLIAADASLELGRAKLAARQAHAVLRQGERLDAPEPIYRAHALLARIARKEGDVPRALDEYDAATETLLQLFDDLAYDQRASFLEDKHTLYSGALMLALEAGEPLRALRYLEYERARAVWMIDLRRDPEIEEHRTKHTAISALLPMLSKDSPALLRARDELRMLARQLQDMLAARAERMSVASTLDEQALLNAAPSGTTALAYALVGADLVIFALAHGSIHCERLASGAKDLEKHYRDLHFELRDLAERLGGEPLERWPAVVGRSERKVRAVLAKLWALLLAPMEQHLPPEGEPLILIPHGLLHEVPLAALYDRGQYLVERWPLRCVPSCQALTQRAQDPPTPLHPPLSLGYSAGNLLPHAGAEAREVARLLGGEAWVGEEANARHLLDEGSSREYLHLSAHGLLRRDSPFSSFIQLADEPLHPMDALLLDLRGCRLVTLSACETAQGQLLSAGDEQIGLSHSFALAGAEAVLAALWRVDDASTFALMQELYASIARGAEAEVALRAAQLAFVRGAYAPYRSHPYFWAGFQLVTHAARPVCAAATPAQEYRMCAASDR